MLKEDAEHPQANFFKGASLVRLKKYSSAEPYLVKAAQNNYQPAVAVQVNLLRAYVGRKQTEKALKKLGELAANGFGSLAVLNNEEFSYLENNRKYINLKKKVDENANPCKYGNDYKRLDFWIGEWDVYTNGTKTADSEISKSVGGCTLHEDYRTSGGFLGRSMSYFDPADKLYKQTWIDKFNNITYFKETKTKEGYLQMIAKSSSGNLSRMTYTYDPKADTVTQTMEASNNKGKTWNTNFTGVYKRKGKK